MYFIDGHCNVELHWNFRRQVCLNERDRGNEHSLSDYPNLDGNHIDIWESVFENSAHSIAKILRIQTFKNKVDIPMFSCNLWRWNVRKLNRGE